MNIGQLKEYIKDLPDDMEIRTQVYYQKYVTDVGLEDNQLIIS